ncbi:Nif3-like dinuclear metal center hexameric protein [bacterium]|nr:Nif3-like dinuclear metal center hexameric protein [candidate division CSSED10-310 bacterium]
MASRKSITRYLDELLRIDSFEDYGPNGMQVEGKHDVQRIVCGVSASRVLFEHAVAENADMVIVHHGLIWRHNDPVIKGWYRDRLKILLEHDMTLLSYHLPLDAHETIGNNHPAAAALGLEDTTEFARIGVRGRFPQPLPTKDLLVRLADFYQHDPLVLGAEREAVSSLALVSGGAAREL